MISIEDFVIKYPLSNLLISAEELFEKWSIENEIDHFLKTQVGNGVLIADVLMNPDIRHDGVPSELLNGFSGLMHEKANTYEKVHGYLLDMARKGPESFHGLLNKIQGQIGENQFAHFVGSHAHAARSGSQKAWDFVVHHSDGDQYVQVKVYQTAHQAIAAVKEVNGEVAAGVVKGYDGVHIVRKIDFAVNDDIYDRVKEEVARQKLHIGVQKIGATHAQIQASLDHANYRITSGLLHNYFNDLFRGAIVGTVMVGAINGYLLWKGKKDQATALIDTAYGAATTTGGVASVLSTKAILGGFMGPLGFPVAMGVGIGTRVALSRFFSRRYMAERLIEDTSRLKWLCSRWQS